ncbi:hypothetical protein EDB85DRAFT_1894566 [Lactarius pseudohatsudake]|nr:hypothetical protein EDB85DRAFT_1894566 [Lactarius pseudohatsudake]
MDIVDWSEWEVHFRSLATVASHYDTTVLAPLLTTSAIHDTEARKTKPLSTCHLFTTTHQPAPVAHGHTADTTKTTTPRGPLATPLHQENLKVWRQGGGVKVAVVAAGIECQGGSGRVKVVVTAVRQVAGPRLAGDGNRVQPEGSWRGCGVTVVSRVEVAGAAGSEQACRQWVMRWRHGMGAVGGGEDVLYRLRDEKEKKKPELILVGAKSQVPRDGSSGIAHVHTVERRGQRRGKCQYHLVVVWSGNWLDGVTTGVVTESCMPRWHGVGTVGGAFARQGGSGRELACGGGWRREPQADVWRGGGDVALVGMLVRMMTTLRGLHEVCVSFEESKNEGEKTHRKKLVWQKSGWRRSVQLWHDLAEPASQAASSPPCRTHHTYGCWGTIPVSTSCEASHCETEEDDGDIDWEGINNLLECPPTSPMAWHAIAIVLDVTPDTDASQSRELKLNACTISPTRPVLTLHAPIDTLAPKQPEVKWFSESNNSQKGSAPPNNSTPSRLPDESTSEHHIFAIMGTAHTLDTSDFALTVQGLDTLMPALPLHFRVPLTDRFNYASLDCSTRVHLAHRGAKLVSSILSSKWDQYMLSPCAAAPQFVRVVIELSPTFELFGGVFKEFTVSVAKMYAMDAEGWMVVSTYVRKNVHGVQPIGTMMYPMTDTSTAMTGKPTVHSGAGSKELTTNICAKIARINSTQYVPHDSYNSNSDGHGGGGDDDMTMMTRMVANSGRMYFPDRELIIGA